jgi:uncharacterized protein (DUF362 family)
MTHKILRRDLLVKVGTVLGSAIIGNLLGGCSMKDASTSTPDVVTDPAIPSQAKGTPVVSIVKIKSSRVKAAVEEAIELLGGIEAVTSGKNRIMLKPNLTTDRLDSATKPEVVKTLARLMQKAGKEVLIGEGSAAANGFNVRDGETYRTQNQSILDRMQQHIFDRLGYSKMAKSLRIPLINLHSGEMVDVEIPDGLLFDKITLHHTLTEIDMLCSVPMMKTHSLATVTLGMKNLMGLYPGTVYCAVRACVHDMAADAGSPGIAFEILDMVRANKLGLVVVDGSMAMEGNGPTEGDLVKMNVIIAGTNPLATDMVAAAAMGFNTRDIPTFTCANEIGMQPSSLDQIEIKGESLDAVKRNFAEPRVYSWHEARSTWATQEIP